MFLLDLFVAEIHTATTKKCKVNSYEYCVTLGVTKLEQEALKQGKGWINY